MYPVYNESKVHLMKSKTLLFLIIGGLVTLGGCNKNIPPEKTPSTDPRAGVISMSPMSPSQQSTFESDSPANASDTAKVRLSPIEISQKEYLDAYNEYVRLLRESGPQTIETLQALAIYQKKYQIYQMLLKAEGDKKN